MSVAERVAEERGEGAPGTPGSTVGYHVRLEAASTRDTRLLFCTTGILLRRLAGERELAAVSVVVVDEVHERSMQGDFLLALLRDLLPRRRAQGRPLKVVLMSATLDASLYAQYFGTCPVLCAEGRTFPVKHRFLEDVYEEVGYRLAPDSYAALRADGRRGLSQFRKQAGGDKGKQQLLRSGWGDEEASSGALNPNYDSALYAAYGDHTRRNLARVNEEVIDMDLLEAVIAHVDAACPEGAILVFLPGMGEINGIHDRLASSRAFSSGGHWLVPLHSSVAPQEQRAAFRRPPEGVRKIVLATNIAETSLTIEDVVYVIDTGRHKERRYDPGRCMSLLVEDWVSRASAMQRKGRAGRVRAGVCYSLYTRQRLEEGLRAYQAPEITRMPLEELVLQIHLMKLGPAADFLTRVLEPPTPRAVASALSTLRQVGALTAAPPPNPSSGPAPPDPPEALTPLGYHLAQLPVQPRLGKLLVLGACLGCLAPALTIAACLSFKSPFAGGLEQQADTAAARAALAAKGSGTVAEGQQSDHLLMVAAYSAWQHQLRAGGKGAAAQFARRHSMAGQTLEQLGEMRSQFAAVLVDMRFVKLPEGAQRPRGAEPPWVDDPKVAWNRYAAYPAVIKALLTAALDPNFVVMAEGCSATSRPTWRDAGGEELFIHPSSLAHPLTSSQFRDPFLVYLEKVKTSRVFLRDCTVVGSVALLLFSGELQVLHDQGAILVDRYVRIKAPASTAVLVKKLRAAVDGLLEDMVQAPAGGAGGSNTRAGSVIDTIVKLLQDEEQRSCLPA